MNPLISIITPLFNRELLISKTIESVRSQSYNNYEHLIVDDGSNDRSMEVVQNWSLKEPRIKIFYRPRDLKKGPSACRNYGVSQARGKYIIFLDSDDLLTPFCLEQRIRYMEEYPELDFGVFNLEQFYNKLGDLKTLFNQYPKEGDSCLKMFLRHQLPWQTACPIWKKETVVALGGFDENIIIMEDPELHTRALLSQNIKFHVVKESPPDCYYRIGHFDIEKSNNFISRSIKGRIYYLKKVGKLITESDLQPETKQDLIQNLSGTYLNLMKHFMLAKVKEHPKAFSDITLWARKNGIARMKLDFLVRMLGYLWLHDNKLVRNLKLKGLLYRYI